MTLVIIAAVARGGAIGRNGGLLAHISADLRRFKALTMGHTIVMGRRTFESLPSGALPGRTNIVVTRNPLFPATGAKRASSVEEALDMSGDENTVFVIGGGELYKQTLDIADRLEITEIDADFPDADTFFPLPDTARWERVEENEPETDPRSGLRYRFVTLRRRR